MDFLGFYFGDPLLIIVGLIAVILVGWAFFALLYMKRLLSKKQIVLVVAILSALGIPFGYVLWSYAYTVIGPTLMFGSIAMLCSSFVMVLVLRRGEPAAPSRAAAPTAAIGAERPAAPIQKVDEDVVRLKVEKTATESALKSLEAAVKEGAITKETFEKHKMTYTDRLAKIDSELSKKTKVGITKLEGEIEKVRKTYMDRLKDLSKKAISIKPAPAAVPKAAVATVAPPVRAPAPRAPEPAPRLPETRIPRTEEGPEYVTPRVTTPPTPAERLPPAPARAAPSGPATISDLRREMMDELNRLKRLIGRAEA